MRAWIPGRHGEVAWGWGEEGLLALARRGARGLNASPWGELRAQARRELGLPTDRPIVASGHQPLPVHPGILLRRLFLSALPEEVEVVWISVDSDAPSAIELPVPLRRERYTFHQLVLLENRARRVLAALPAPTEALLSRAWARLEVRLATLKNRTILERAARAWGRLPQPQGNWAGWWEEAAMHLAGIAGQRTISVSELAAAPAFRAFVELLLSSGEGLLAAYQRAAARAGVPLLPPGELPFWRLEAGRRRPARTPREIALPRALTLTLYLRAVVCDFFLHGAGGAGYEPGVDLLFREALGVKPPPWGWLTGTFLLPEPEGERLPGREYPFFLHDLAEVQGALAGPLAAI